MYRTSHIGRLAWAHPSYFPSSLFFLLLMCILIRLGQSRSLHCGWWRRDLGHCSSDSVASILQSWHEALFPHGARMHLYPIWPGRVKGHESLNDSLADRPPPHFLHIITVGRLGGEESTHRADTMDRKVHLWCDWPSGLWVWFQSSPEWDSSLPNTDPALRWT